MNCSPARDWLRAERCTHVVMERTSSFWRPIYHLLQGHCDLLVVTASHAKAVPGRKTDVTDAEWLADPARATAWDVPASSGPARSDPCAQRHLRDLTRYRSHLIEERARLTNRLQAVREDANSKLAAVVTDVRGVSARAILEALSGGETDSHVLAELARGRVRAKRDLLAPAVVGRFAPHHAFLLTEPLTHRDVLEEAIARVSAEMDHRLAAEREAMAWLDTIPGVRGAHRRRVARRDRQRSPAASRARGMWPRGRGCVPATSTVAAGG